MSKVRDEFIKTMRKEHKWIVIPVGLKDINMHRKIGKHHVSVRLEETDNKKFRIHPAGYTYQSACSHFTYAQKEIRWSRNKNTLQAIMVTLKNSCAIKFIDNLDEFIIINENCKKSNKKKLQEDLKNLTTK
jgi:hypothetical protein